MNRKHRRSLLASLLGGIAFIAVMSALKQAPEHQAIAEHSTAVRIRLIEPAPFTLSAQGYGHAEPATRWQAVAAVGGRVTWRHPDLENGRLIPADTLILTTDPTRYELAVDGAKADIEGIQAELRQLTQEQHDTRALLALERERLALSSRELARTRKLVDGGALPPSRLDEQQRANLQQQQAVQALDNRLNAIPDRQGTLMARLARSETNLARAQEDLADTRIQAPFDLRIDSVQVESGQQVSPGQSLFSGDGIEQAEVTIQLPVDDLRRILSGLPTGTGRQAGALPPPPELPDLHQRFPLDAIDARVTLVGSPDVQWPAQVIRIAGGLDPATRTVPVVLSVEEPYRNASPPLQPPLARGMFVEARLQTHTQEAQITVPASSVHQGVVYLATAENRLERRAVTVHFIQHNLAVISSGLARGDRLILDDLVPAIDGMAVHPVSAPALAATATADDQP